MKLYAICATCGRHTLLERSVRYFLEQSISPEDDYTLLIFNNSDTPLSLDIHENVPFNVHITLINQYQNSATGKRYANLGSIYNDAITNIPPDCQIVTHWDDDDTFLENHLQEGIKGFKKALEMGKLAYKPEKSWYRHSGGVELMGNNLEPSIFVDAGHLKLYGYSQSTTDQHLEWLNPLMTEGKLYVDPNGEPTLVYDWRNDVPTWKTSGAPDNFLNYRSFSKDHGDKIVTPVSLEAVKKYYNLY